jgi:hypothetical protein
VLLFAPSFSATTLISANAMQNRAEGPGLQAAVINYFATRRLHFISPAWHFRGFVSARAIFFSRQRDAITPFHISGDFSEDGPMISDAARRRIKAPAERWRPPMLSILRRRWLCRYDRGAISTYAFGERLHYVALITDGFASLIHMPCHGRDDAEARFAILSILR